ncbi:TonB-dependent receptor plug domain-containing protein [Undibacterium fentianense]|uniref:TonB-dependent receptor n=1 Tax=Undibacterium fentianense TaxID=2828728 RepID=A0A941E2Y5_9BURK|nr:TonB-dependent receptor [Undibacterium fentianense]MBR7800496.1 TonB-dependent receptor [Undibacterium fentianense]
MSTSNTYAQEKVKEGQATGVTNETQQSVEVKSRKFDAKRDDTAMKQIVTRAEIEKFGDTNLVEVLRRQSGISVKGNIVSLNGLDGYTQILVDGQPLLRGTTIDTLNLNQIDRVEIIRSATAEHSTQAIGGTINIVLRGIAKFVKRNLKVAVDRWGSDTLFSNLSLQFSDKTEQFAYDVGMRIADARLGENKYLSVESINLRDHVLSKQNTKLTRKATLPSLNIEPRFVWTLGNGDQLTISNSVYFQPIDIRTTGIGLTEDQTSNVKSANETHYSDQRFAIGSTAKLDHRFGGDAKMSVNFGVNSASSKQSQTDYANQGAPSFSVVKKEFDDKQTTVKFFGNFESPLTQGHQVKTGWDLGREFHSVDGGVQSQDITIYRAAAYAQDEWQTTPLWSNYFGLRWEGFQTRVTDVEVMPWVSNTNVFSPIYQTLLKFENNKENQVRLALARTFRNPNFRELVSDNFRGANNSVIYPDFVGNYRLKPEIALGVDGAFEHFGKDGLKFSASFYAKQIQNVIQRDLRFVNNRWVSQPNNDGKAQAKGIEIDVKFPLNLLLKDLNHIAVQANLGRNWSSVLNVPGPNNRLLGQPRITANLGIDYQPNDTWSLGSAFNFASEGDVRSTVYLSSYSKPQRRLDSYLSYKVSSDAKLRLTMNNLLGQDQISVNHYQDFQNQITTLEKALSNRRIGINFETRF